MARYSTGNNQPLGHWNSLPIYLTTLITAGMALALIFCAVVDVLQSPFARWLIFAMPLDPAWSLWRAVSHVLIDRISFFTPFGLFFFYWMGVGVETHLGRVVLGKLMLALVVTAPAVAAVWYAGFGQSSVTFGNYMFLAAMLVAFATLYPNTEAWGWVPFKWVAFACIVCGSLMILAERNWLQLAQLWASCGVAFGFVQQAKEAEFDDAVPLSARVAKWFARKPKFHVLPRPAERRMRSREAEEDLTAEIDPLLEKISKTGMSSLTPKERAQLEKAREALLQRGPGRK